MESKHTLSYVAVLFIVVALGSLAYFNYRTNQSSQPDDGFSFTNLFGGDSGEANLQKFTSADDFKQYLASTNGLIEDYYYSDFFSPRFEEMEFTGAIEDSAGVMVDSMSLAQPLSEGEFAKAERYSQTNVQVTGIDEPDIVKTNGEHIFYSQPYAYFYDYAYEKPTTAIADIPDYSGGVVDVLNTLPVDKLELVSQIDTSGDLLLNDETLIVLTVTGVSAYSIAQPAQPEPIWEMEFDDAVYQAARLYNDSLYLVTTTYINQDVPCPYTPVIMKESPITIPCIEIYHPVNFSPIDATFTVFKVKVADGSVQDTISMTGLQTKSVIYMSPENLYITHIERAPIIEIVRDFLTTDGADLVSSEVKNRLAELETYTLSVDSQEIELSNALDRYFRSLSDDEELRAQTDFQNRMGEYVKEHARDLEHTSIAKLDITDFAVQATGRVAGVLLNQYSLDEYQGNLRLATTVGERAQDFWLGSYWFDTSEASVNDLYVLDSSLRERGSVKDLGEGERIYSARFLGDQAYLVTFRETDPFYVFDLSNPDSPRKVGELKIPGYSSYLHPLEDDLIVGIGQEGSQVKVSLFDVSDPSDPQEVSKYMLNEYWSDILDTQHAFLQDAEHGVFFVPGSTGGYVLSYKDRKLNLAAAVKLSETKRAVYVNDYLYVLGASEMVVLSEKTWERVGEIKL